MKFPNRESQGGSGCRRSAGKDNRNPEVLSSPKSRGGSGLSNTTAADLGFYAICLLIFVATPVFMVLS